MSLDPHDEPRELLGIKYPAKKHALKVKSHFLTKKPSASDSAILIAGATLEYYAYCDETISLRQNRYFHYITGVDQIPGCFVLFNLVDDKLTLYLPEIDYDDVMWSGFPLNLEEAAKQFDVDEVRYAGKLSADLKEVWGKVYTPDTKDYEKEPFAKSVVSGDNDLFYALDEARLIKDSYEIALIKHANKITAISHEAVMSAQPIETNETHIHAEFVYHSIRQGSKFQAYSPICCSGPSCGTLHYVKNDSQLKDKFSVLIDAGAEWKCYSSDVTRCFPINGDWTKEHLQIYKIVQAMQQSVMDAAKPGVSWDSMHLLTHKVLIEHFLKLGLFKNGTVDEILKSGVSVWFYPHGLGHLMGMDVHDVGGYPNYEDADPMYRWLRIRRDLQEGMVVTDEPGVYFNDYLLEQAKKNPDQSKYIDLDVVKKYMYVGGVRIEDDLLITKTGCENLTTITSDPDEISALVKKGLAKGREGFHVVA